MWTDRPAALLLVTIASVAAGRPPKVLIVAEYKE
jgi:hypothetical protein